MMSLQAAANSGDDSSGVIPETHAVRNQFFSHLVYIGMEVLVAKLCYEGLETSGIPVALLLVGAFVQGAELTDEVLV